MSPRGDNDPRIADEACRDKDRATGPPATPPHVDQVRIRLRRASATAAPSASVHSRLRSPFRSKKCSIVNIAWVYVHGDDKMSLHSAGNPGWGPAQEYITMSFFPAKDPALGDARAADAIDLVIVPRSVDVGHFAVRRALPHARRRMVGPFIFFDHFGPAEFRTGQGIDVRPHPHIGLATVTFLFDGEIMHRDSLGTAAAIRPGEVNWMSAGRGIVHSERTASDHRKDGEPIHGLQCWVALPAAEEESAPAFFHHDSAALPLVSDADKTARIIAGSAYGERSPVATLWDTLFVDVTLVAGATLPIDAETEERAIYLISGEVDIAGDKFTAGRLLIFRPGDALAVTAVSDARLVLLGGAAMDGPRHIWWNFVSSRKERIEQAKADWKLARFDTVPGDDKEFIPLPE
jgi:redox-sensitive bicupin YhaK (pirin superfamily)